MLLSLLLALALGSHSEPAPTSEAAADFRYGVFDDHHPFAGRAAADLPSLVSRGFDTVVLVNGSADEAEATLAKAGVAGIHVILGPHDELLKSWWPAGVPATIEQARDVAYPLADRLRDYPALDAYYLVDEPDVGMAAKLNLIGAAFNERDPDRPAVPLLVGLDRASLRRDGLFLFDAYPYGARNMACDDRMIAFGYGDLRLAEYLRRMLAHKAPLDRSHVVLQAHRADAAHLREPTPAEMRQEFWTAVGLGIDGVSWFAWSSQQGWIGLVDNPMLLAEAEALGRRVNRPLLSRLGPGGPSVTVAGPADAYPLTDGTAHYVVLVNRTCAAQAVTTVVDVTDVETNSSFTAGAKIPLGPGDGGLFALQ